MWSQICRSESLTWQTTACPYEECSKPQLPLGSGKLKTHRSEIINDIMIAQVTAGMKATANPYTHQKRPLFLVYTSFVIFAFYFPIAIYFLNWLTLGESEIWLQRNGITKITQTCIYSLSSCSNPHLHILLLWYK